MSRNQVILRVARVGTVQVFYSESESKRKQIIRFFVSTFMHALLSQMSLIILQGAGVGEVFYSQSDLALESECFPEPVPHPQRPKILLASHSCEECRS